ncbi:MAG: 2,3-diphosphoglycerate-dependent phosphoglycerate mutase [Dehalococcoidia bacterium]|jgi:2,3-bisphosphoglycerate-dependent phosphoglycerate mutase|nr:2,3-diphosphoglycerate-dependent phosphoglycerate mutase [Dehalococcoidia bacterium]
MTHQVVLLRHGESTWNKENRFAGWVDIDLSDTGKEEALSAAKQLKESGFEFDIAFSSVLKRAIRTLWIILDELDQLWIPSEKSWQLNERHYGALAGLNKVETVERHGEEQVFIWRRSFDTRPPPLEENDPNHPRFEKRYSSIGLSAAIPSSESLKDTMARVIPFWNSEIVPRVKNGERVLISAHGNSIRALVKHFDNITDADISEINIPTGMPLIYEFDENMSAQNHYYLGGAAAAAAAAAAVAAQTSKKD